MADIFEPYNAFLGMLSDTETRKRLENLHPEQALDDAAFQETRKIGNRFQDGLSALFFGSDDKLKDAVQRYGVF